MSECTQRFRKFTKQPSRLDNLSLFISTMQLMSGILQASHSVTREARWRCKEGALPEDSLDEGGGVGCKGGGCWDRIQGFSCVIRQ